MARTDLTPQLPSATGIVPTFAAAPALGSQFRNSGRSILHVKNGGGVSIDVTIPTPGTVDGLALADQIVAVAAGAEKLISVRNRETYKQADGYTYVDYSAVTSVTVALYEGGAA